MDKEKRNYVVTVVGDPGTGKSLGACTFACNLDPAFNIGRVVFKREDLMQLVQTLPPCSAIVADETGKWFGARDWNTSANKFLTEIMEIWRYKRLAVFFTLPLAAQADITLRRMGNATIETNHILFDEQMSENKFKIRSINPLSSDIKRLFPRMYDENGNVVTVSKLYIGKVSDEFEKQYDSKKIAWSNNMVKNGDNDEEDTVAKPQKINKKTLILKDLNEGLKVADIARKRKAAQGYIRELRQISS